MVYQRQRWRIAQTTYDHNVARYSWVTGVYWAERNQDD